MWLIGWRCKCSNVLSWPVLINRGLNHYFIFLISYIFFWVCFNCIQNFYSDDNIEEIPVPIPNTEVKLYCAEDICGLPCWENRLSPDFFYCIAKIFDFYCWARLSFLKPCIFAKRNATKGEATFLIKTTKKRN